MLVLVEGKSYEPGPVGLMYFCCSGSFPFSLNPDVELNKKLPLLYICGLYSPGPSEFPEVVTFLWDLPKVLSDEE